MLTRSQARQLSSEFPVGDPFGGPAYGERNDPVSMATVMPIFSVVGTAFSVIGALNQGRQQNQAAQYNAQIQEQNAGLARQNAADSARQQERETYQRLGAIRAGQGHSGGTGDSGSVLDVLGDVAAQGEYEKQYIKYQGELQARGFSNTAQLDRYQGENAQTSSYFKAGSELLSGSYNYNQLKRK